MVDWLSVLNIYRCIIRSKYRKISVPYTSANCVQKVVVKIEFCALGEQCTVVVRNGQGVADYKPIKEQNSLGGNEKVAVDRKSLQKGGRYNSLDCISCHSI